MAPESYRGSMKADDEGKTTYSQSQQSSLREKGTGATVATILADKGSIVYTITPEASVADALLSLRDHKCGALIVSQGHDSLPVGILSERDIVRRLADTGAEALSQPVSALMTSDLVTCHPAERLIEMLRRMTEGRFRHLPVVEGERLVGLVTLGDVVKARLAELEYEALRMKQMIVG